jgi:hypothetical protein
MERYNLRYGKMEGCFCGDENFFKKQKLYKERKRKR